MQLRDNLRGASTAIDQASCYLSYLLFSCFFPRGYLAHLVCTFPLTLLSLPTNFKTSNNALQQHASQRSVAPGAEVPRRTSPCYTHNPLYPMGNTIQLAGSTATPIPRAICVAAPKRSQPSQRRAEASREPLRERRDQTDPGDCEHDVVDTCHVWGVGCRDAEERGGHDGGA